MKQHAAAKLASLAVRVAVMKAMLWAVRAIDARAFAPSLQWGLRRLVGAPTPISFQSIKASERPLNVLCYAPYTRFSLHTAWETLLLHALRARGHRTEYVMCDGIYTQCDIVRAGGKPYLSTGPHAVKGRYTCSVCRVHARMNLARFSMSSRPISHWLSADEQATARSWAAELAPGDFLAAKYRDWPVGQWVVSSVVSHFRSTILDLDDEGVRTIFRRYLESGLAACFALNRMLEDVSPDLLILFNGRMSSTRIALEIAKRRGVRVMVEERGRVPRHIRFIENENCLYLGDLDRLWEKWRDIPLNETELGAITALLERRSRGQSFEVRAFGPSVTSEEFVRRELRLDDRPVWLMLTSSVDESLLEPRARGLFASQNAWARAMVDYAREHRDIQVVLRVHPNVGSTRSVGRNADDIAFFRGLTASAPENVRIIQPDQETSTYSLMAMAHVGFIWHSITGLEMASHGKRVFRSGGWFMAGKEFLEELGPGRDFAETLARARQPWTPDDARRTARLALRCAYIWFFRQSYPLPLVSQPKWYSGDYAFPTAEAILPGRTLELDRIVDVLTGAAPLHPEPAAAERARGTAAEDDFLLRSISPSKQSEYA